MAEEKKTKHNKADKPKEKKVKQKKVWDDADYYEKPRRRIPWGWILFLLLVIALVICGFVLKNHVQNDLHKTPSDNLGTVVDGCYCFYLEDKDTIISFSTSKGPRAITREDTDYAPYMEKMKEHYTDVDPNTGIEAVKAAMGENFDESSYKFVDQHIGNILYLHNYEGHQAVWLYSSRSKTVDMVIDDQNIKPLAFANDVVYVRDSAKEETVCYRISTSYSRKLISVDPFMSVTSDRASFLTITMLDLMNGLIRGFKASRNSN